PTSNSLAQFPRIWCVDFEFTAGPGERPRPLCVVARECRTGAVRRLWLADGAPPAPPYGTAPASLFAAHYASAEFGCHLALGWPMPARVLDLYAEFRCHTSGRGTPANSYGLLGALTHFGLDGLSVTEKTEMRDLAQRGGPYAPEEQAALTDYC